MRRTLLAGIIAGVCIVGGVSAVWEHAANAALAPVGLAVTADVPVLSPRVALAQPQQAIVFTNTTAQDLEIQTTPHSPAQARLTVPAGGTARLTLTTPGLYHFYDAATAHVIDYAAATDVLHTLPNAPIPDLPDQGWVVVPGPGGVPVNESIDVPAQNDLMAPRVGAVRVGGSIILHNHDTDPHNMVTDPADPTGAAFELLGTDGEPSIHGAERRITFSEPGLYHVYCSIHSHVMTTVGGWQMVMPRDSHATGYADGNPMEAWFLVVP